MNIEQVKRWVIIAMASDDFLTEQLVLKGGNAIDLLLPPASGRMSRASYDLDFSIGEDFEGDLTEVKQRIQRTLARTFLEQGFVVLDFQFALRPRIASPETSDFWGGYLISFKIISIEDYELLKDDEKKLINSTLAIHPNHSTRIEIEISKYEFVEPRMELSLDGYTIFIYSPEMIVFEKLRALCQQLPQYSEIVPSFSPRPRARDFYDIHLICEQHPIDPHKDACKEMIAHIFAAKKVPVSFITLLKDHTAIHEQGWQDVLDTLPAGQKTEPFSYYADFVLQMFEGLTFP
jgi:predicted nucleotidyltransferase component of viral defense system